MCDSCTDPSRRFFLKAAGLGALALAAPRLVLSEEDRKSAGTPAHAGPKVPPDEALARLMEGNRRFVENRRYHPNESTERRAQLSNSQTPFAAVLACADSRVSPEIVFDHGLGDLFVVRVAGNIVEDAGSGSLEYAVEHLGVSLIVVLGHERCGAVKAAVESVCCHRDPPGHIAELVRKIRPAVEKVKSMSGDKYENAMRENARINAAELAGLEPILKEKVDAGALKVVAMRYDLDTGSVESL